MAQQLVHATSGIQLADVLERILDKGVVVAADVRVKVVDIELLTINIRLLLASVDRAKEMGIDWWEHSPFLSEKGRAAEMARALEEKERQVQRLEKRIARLERPRRSSTSKPHGAATVTGGKDHG